MESICVKYVTWTIHCLTHMPFSVSTDTVEAVSPCMLRVHWMVALSVWLSPVLSMVERLNVRMYYLEECFMICLKVSRIKTSTTSSWYKIMWILTNHSNGALRQTVIYVLTSLTKLQWMCIVTVAMLFASNVRMKLMCHWIATTEDFSFRRYRRMKALLTQLSCGKG